MTDIAEAMAADHKWDDAQMDREYQRGYQEGWASAHEEAAKAEKALRAIYDYTLPTFLPDDGGPWLLTVHVMARAALGECPNFQPGDLTNPASAAENSQGCPDCGRPWHEHYVRPRAR